jgi:hypothetical protein
MQDISQLKKIVIESFEAKGILSEIRAQIRASVFKVVEESEQEQNKTNFEWERKNPLEITQSDDKLILALLIDDFLSHMDLQYSSNVFTHESNLKLKTENKEKQKELLKSIGLKENTSEPMLYQILRNMNKTKSEKELEEKEKLMSNKKEKENQEKHNEMMNFEKQEEEPYGMELKRKQESMKEVSMNNNEHHEMMNNIQLNELNQMNDENERREIDENDDQEDPNQMYLNEPAVLDVTADSDLLKEFDHEESVENYS